MDTGNCVATKGACQIKARLSDGTVHTALNPGMGGSLSQAERDALVGDLRTGVRTRAEVLRRVAEDADFEQREFNRALS